MEYAKEVLVLHYNNPASFFFLSCWVFSLDLTLIPKYCDCCPDHSQCITISIRSIQYRFALCS